MKRIIFITTLICLISSVCFAQKKEGFNLKISIKNYSLDTIRVVSIKGGDFTMIDVPLKKGKGEAVVNVPINDRIIIMSKEKGKSIQTKTGIVPGPMVTFFSEGDQPISIDIDNNLWPIFTIKGGKLSSDYMKLRKETGPLVREKFEVEKKLFGDAKYEKNAELQNQRKAISEKISQIELDYVIENPNSYVALDLLAGQRNSMELSEYEKRFNLLSATLKELPVGREIAKYIDAKKSTVDGMPAPTFEKLDKDGKTIKLSDYRGSYLLVDFWGTWCGPCRSSHPHLVALYEKYNGLGLKFLNVAQENGVKDRATWLKAVVEDKLSWTQIFNNEGQEKCDMVKAFAVSAFPTKILISPDGKIIARFIGGGDEIDAKLKEIFKQ